MLNMDAPLNTRILMYTVNILPILRCFMDMYQSMYLLNTRQEVVDNSCSIFYNIEYINIIINTKYNWTMQK
jgi:hypothetical protein